MNRWEKQAWEAYEVPGRAEGGGVDLDSPFAQGAAAAGIGPTPPPVQAPPAAPVAVPAAAPATPTTPIGPPKTPVPGSGAPTAPDGNPVVVSRRISAASPAQEVATRGPIAGAALMQGIEAQAQANEKVDLATAMQADREKTLYENIAEQQQKQTEAIQRAAAKREQAMLAMRSDFEDHAAKVAQMQLDPNRFWGSKTTWEKIGTLLLVAIGGGQATKAIDDQINRDIEAQKFAYKAQLDHLENRKTAFSLAMQQFQDEDAAAAQARASALLASKSQIEAMGAQWKGTEAHNRAMKVAADLQAEAGKVLAGGLKYVPPSVTDRYVVAVNGVMLPAAMSGDKANEFVTKYGVEHKNEMEKLEAQQQGKGVENVRKYAEDLEKAGIPAAKTALSSAKEALKNSPKGDLEAAANNLGIDFQKHPFLYKQAESMGLLSKDSSRREQSVAKFQVLIMRALSGAAITESESPRLYAFIRGANDQASLTQAFSEAEKEIAAKERNFKAGDPVSAAKYEKNLSRLSPEERGEMPATTVYPGKK